MYLEVSGIDQGKLKFLNRLTVEIVQELPQNTYLMIEWKPGLLIWCS